MSDVNRVITLGIGPASTIEAFILSGLNTSLVYTGIKHTFARRRLEALDVVSKVGTTGFGMVVGRRIETLDIKRNG